MSIEVSQSIDELLRRAAEALEHGIATADDNDPYWSKNGGMLALYQDIVAFRERHAGRGIERLVQLNDDQLTLLAYDQGAWQRWSEWFDVARQLYGNDVATINIWMQFSGEDAVSGDVDRWEALDANGDAMMPDFSQPWWGDVGVATEFEQNEFDEGMIGQLRDDAHVEVLEQNYPPLFDSDEVDDNRRVTLTIAEPPRRRYAPVFTVDAV